jgi:uncharacterized protein HemY
LRSDWSGVLNEASALAPLHRGDDVLWLCAGIAAIKAARWSDARLYLEPALQLRGGDSLARYWVGEAWAGSGETELALRAFEEAVRAAPAAWPLATEAKAKIAALRR